MREDLRNAIGNAVERFEAIARDAFEARDFASAGSALVIAHWLGKFTAVDRGQVALPKNVYSSPECEAIVKEGRLAPKKRAARKPKGGIASVATEHRESVQEFLDDKEGNGKSDTDPPPPPNGKRPGDGDGDQVILGEPFDD